MKVCNYLDIKPTEITPGAFRRDVIGADDGALSSRMSVYEVEPGSSTLSHSHPWEHEAFILSGRGVMLSGEKETQIAKDSVIFIAPDEHHSFVNNSNEPLRYVVVTPIVD